MLVTGRVCGVSRSARHTGGVAGPSAAREAALARLASLRLRQRNGHRSPHKPLLVLLALGRVDTTGSSEFPWSEAESRLADPIAEFGSASRTGRLQSAAYPFTRLRSDGVWQLDCDVPMDEVKPLSEHDVTGRFEPTLEASMRTDRSLVFAIARALVTSHFPETVASEVLTAVRLDPTLVLRAPDVLAEAVVLANDRRRNSGWRSAVLQAWDRQCAFCGYDGQLAGAPVGVEAACAVVRVRRTRHAGQRAGSLCAAPQAVRSWGARPRCGDARPRLDDLHDPYRRWPHGVRPARTRTASAPRDDAAGWSARRLARSRGL